MVDITKCKGDGCDKKNSCYRNRAISGQLQSFFIENPPKDESGNCDYFISTEGYKRLNPIEEESNANI